MFCKLLFLALVVCYVQAKCGQNESYDVCGRNCEPSCSYRRPACDMVCEGDGGCRCNFRFYRHPNGSCVSANDCPRN